MTLKEKIEKDFKAALKERKELEISVLRLLKAAILNKEKEKKFEKKIEKEYSLSDEEIISLIFSEIKKRKEALIEFERGKRLDLVEKEKKEIEVLEKYLPQQLSVQEIEDLVKETIAKVKAKELKDLGRVMKELMPKIKGKADGALVNQIVKKYLSQINL